MTDVPFPEDRALAVQCADGDPRAWEILLDRAGPRIRALARRLLGSEDAAEDAVAEAFAHFLDRRGGVLRAYRGTAPLEAYLHVIAKRGILRRREIQPSRVPEALLAQVPAPEAEAPDARLVLLQGALGELPAAWRELLAMVYEQGLSQREAARRLGIPAGTAATWVSRALRRLEGEIGDS